MTSPTARGLLLAVALLLVLIIAALLMAATVLYTRGREQHPRCKQHDTIAATHVGWTRVDAPESVREGRSGSTGVVAA